MTAPTLAELVTPATEVDAITNELTIAQSLGLPTTSWPPLGMARTILAINATIISEYSDTVSFVAQGAYASYAALMVDDNGNPVTTWMDLRGVDQYNEDRIPSTQAAGNVPVTNEAGVASYTWSPNSPIRFQNPATGATYTTTGSGTIPYPSAAVVQVPVIADAAYAGSSGTTGAGVTLTMLTPLAFVDVLPLAASIVGLDAESNAHYLARCQAKLGAISPNGAASAYQYVVESLPVFGGALPTGQPFTAPTAQNPYGVTTPVTRATDSFAPFSGLITVYVANASGGLLGSAQNVITGVTNAIPAVVTTQSPHGIPVGATSYVILSGIVGASGANNAVAGQPAWVGTYVSANTFSINNTATPGAYSSGGSAEVGDLGMADAAIQSTTVPTGQIAVVVSASTVTIPLVCTTYISAKSSIPPASAQAAIVSALAQYLATIPIGGITAESAGIVPWSEILTTIAGANVGTVSVVLTTPTADVSIAANQIPLLTVSPTISVNYV